MICSFRKQRQALKLEVCSIHLLSLPLKGNSRSCRSIGPIFMVADVSVEGLEVASEAAELSTRIGSSVGGVAFVRDFGKEFPTFTESFRLLKAITARSEVLENHKLELDKLRETCVSVISCAIVKSRRSKSDAPSYAQPVEACLNQVFLFAESWSSKTLSDIVSLQDRVDKLEVTVGPAGNDAAGCKLRTVSHKVGEIAQPPFVVVRVLSLDCASLFETLRPC